ncbi:hypothetical protein GGTG_13380 [Gaeumannomyces tritici R3-111a-1]|uniref:Uncharacterized protein n=1 Tax=Gaeumannomyces tritici (strain R3-111a-1) TaxID=644352 RepID=J3PIQ1_GAET3|nr:hypothetical protein GGTG_13380 [Gaeumannomyces tritici R3-111a-1]EJT69112.1 hypothetical protein GGTG_13380 [Gaeumannomyces tritici R3-111a-1]
MRWFHGACFGVAQDRGWPNSGWVDLEGRLPLLAVRAGPSGASDSPGFTTAAAAVAAAVGTVANQAHQPTSVGIMHLLTGGDRQISELMTT